MSINYEVSGNVATITLDRPQAHNAMDTAAYREITERLRELDSDPDVRVGIVTGAGGRAFSAGADLKEMHGDGEQLDPWAPWQPDRWDLGVTIAKPLIAAIDGYALAGGLELALLCDLRIATPRSQFGCPEVKWNLLHGFGALRLPAVVGLTNAMMLLLTGEFIDAEEALRIGLINRVAEPDELMDAAEALAGVISANARDAVHMTKALALRGIDGSLEEGLRLYKSYMTQLESSDEQARRTRSFAQRQAAREADPE